MPLILSSKMLAIMHKAYRLLESQVRFEPAAWVDGIVNMATAPEEKEALWRSVK